jgi:hypothetical protein
MRRTLIVLGLVCFVGQPAAAPAQEPVPMTYNQARAYRHFLTSPYSYRTYSGTTPGFAVEGFTPFGYEGYARGPGYFQHRITPRGYESYYLAPPETGFRIRPPAFAPYPMPGYGYPYGSGPAYP